MSIHLDAKPGDIASSVLITGDPVRASHHAEKFLQDPVCYNRVRAMYGYTGKYNGKRVSIQGTGIGIPSTALYVHELVHFYGAKCIIRVGTCGAIQEDIKLGQIILADGALTDSNVVQHYFKDPDFRPVPDARLLQQAQETAKALDIPVLTGKIFSTDLFYSEQPNRWDDAIRQGVLGVEMETSVLYTLAARYKFQCLTILTVSDNIFTGETATAQDREQKTSDMIRLAFEIAP